MPIDEEDELAALRRRAYAPDGDISADPEALSRLIELEARVAARDAAPVSARPRAEEPTPEERGPAQPAPLSPTPATPDAPTDADSDATPERPQHPRSRPRRSRVLVIGAVVLVAAIWITTLLLVQGARSDPLRAGVEEVARLSPDPGYEAPGVLYRGVTGKVTAYTAFEGFRVISYPSFREGDQVPRCMTIWQPDLLEEDGSGLSYGGEGLVPSCGAGAFPAAYTILLTDGSAERALTDLPPDTALQFVYDEDVDQIVVFRG